MESDWRKFTEMVPMLRERYLAEQNCRIVRLLTNSNKNETERFWDALEHMEKQSKILHRCLDGHSRSKMWLFMIFMLGAGMLRNQDLSQFSEELQRDLGPEISRAKS